MKISSKKPFYKRKKIIAIILIVVILAAGAGVFALTNTNGKDADPSKDKAKPEKTEEKTKKESVASENKSSSSQSDAIASISDQKSDKVENQTGGISSASGNITLFAPSEDQTVTTATKVEGSSKVTAVQYRLKDSVHGVIGTGELNAKDGYFSGIISIKTSAQKGTLEIYSLDPQGREINSIKINIRYQ